MVLQWAVFWLSEVAGWLRHVGIQCEQDSPTGDLSIRAQQNPGALKDIQIGLLKAQQCFHEGRWSWGVQKNPVCPLYFDKKNNWDCAWKWWKKAPQGLWAHSCWKQSFFRKVRDAIKVRGWVCSTKIGLQSLLAWGTLLMWVVPLRVWVFM